MEEGAIKVLAGEVLKQFDGKVSKAMLIAAVEDRMGRRLTATERGLGVWKARNSFLAEHHVEVMSSKGALSVADSSQSLERRAKERRRALRTLERSADRAAQLAENNNLTDEERKSFQVSLEKSNTMLVHAAAALRKKRSLPGLD